MAEENIVKINLRKQMENMPKWKRKAVFGKFLRIKLKNTKLKIAQNLNEKIWSLKSPKIRIKIIRDDKSAKAELVE